MYRYESVALLDVIAVGKMAGPRMPASGTLLAIPDGHGTPLIALENEIAEEARLNTRRNIENGVNAIKGAGGVICKVLLPSRYS